MAVEKQIVPCIFAPGNEQEFVCAKGNYQDLMDVLAGVAMPDTVFDPVFYQPDWRNHTPREWTAGMYGAALDAARNHNTDRVVLGGFSLGARTAIHAALQLGKASSSPTPVGVLAASTSPYCERTFPVLMSIEPDATDNLTAETIRQLRASPIPDPGCNVQLYVGGRERPYMHVQAGMATERIAAAQLIMVPDANHNVLHPSYLREIATHVGKLALPHDAFMQQASAAFT